MMSEIHKIVSDRRDIERKAWKTEKGTVRAIAEDQEKTKRIEEQLSKVMRKLDAIEAGGGGGGGGGGGVGNVVGFTKGMIGFRGDDSGSMIVGGPATRLRRNEHKDEASLELELRHSREPRPATVSGATGRRLSSRGQRVGY